MKDEEEPYFFVELPSDSVERQALLQAKADVTYNAVRSDQKPLPSGSISFQRHLTFTITQIHIMGVTFNIENGNRQIVVSKALSDLAFADLYSVHFTCVKTDGTRHNITAKTTNAKVHGFDDPEIQEARAIARPFTQAKIKTLQRRDTERRRPSARNRKTDEAAHLEKFLEGQSAALGESASALGVGALLLHHGIIWLMRSLEVMWHDKTRLVGEINHDLYSPYLLFPQIGLALSSAVQRMKGAIGHDSLILEAISSAQSPVPELLRGAADITPDRSAEALVIEALDSLGWWLAIGRKSTYSIDPVQIDRGGRCFYVADLLRESPDSVVNMAVLSWLSEK